MSEIKNTITIRDNSSAQLKKITKAFDTQSKALSQLVNQYDKLSQARRQSASVRLLEKTATAVNRSIETEHRLVVKLKAIKANALVSEEKDQRRHNFKMQELARRQEMWMEQQEYRNQQRIERRQELDKASNPMGKFSTGLHTLSSLLYTGERLFNMASRLINTPMEKVDSVRSQIARLDLYNTSDMSSRDAYGMLVGAALNTRANLQDTADLTNRMLAANIYTGDDAVQNTIDKVALINKALVASGGTQKEVSSLLLQLSQGLAQGELQGQELRAIRQYSPYIGSIIAEGLNKQDIFDKAVVFGDLKELGSQGKLTSARIIKAFELMRDKINSDFEKMPKTWGQAMENLNTIWTVFLYGLSENNGVLAQVNEKMWEFVTFLQSDDATKFWQGVTASAQALFNIINFGLDSLISGITWLGENIQYVITIVTILGVIFSAVFVTTHFTLLLIIGGIILFLQTLSKLGIDIGSIFGVILGIINVIITGISYLADLISTTLANCFKFMGSIALNILGNITEAIGKIMDALGIDLGATLINKGAGWISRAEELANQMNEWKPEKSVTDTFMEGYNKGIDILNVGEHFVLDKYSNGNFWSGGVADTYVTGGSLDSGGTVDLSKEDIQLLRDIAARDFLLNISTITPQVTNNFGDIRETADINAIMDEIDRMVNEEIATSVVMG